MTLENIFFPQLEEFLYEENPQNISTLFNCSLFAENCSNAYADSSTPWVQVNLEGFDPVFYWRGANNYAVIDDSFVEYHGLLYAGTDNPNQWSRNMGI